MMLGEIVSIKHIHEAVPDLVPEPIAWGSYLTVPNTHFLLLSFVNMTDDIPDIDRLPRKVAELHQKGRSLNGKFGFPVQNYQGRLSQVTTWTDTWEECFANNLRGMLEHEQKTQGPNARLEVLSKDIFEKVIPRLLRPLETGGRHIEARLVHGDLWDGNCSTAVGTDGPVIYDASALYAHNECKFAMWDELWPQSLTKQMSLHHGDALDTKLGSCT
jgi:fructosamine-3-kinase